MTRSGIRLALTVACFFAAASPALATTLYSSPTSSRSTQPCASDTPCRLDYALLANNVNCILCHATIDDAARVFNKDPSKFGTFDRVKVGALESLMLRGSSTTTIAGT